MEYQKCYIYEPPVSEEPTPKRQRTSKYDPYVQLPARLEIYRELWAAQEARIQNTLEEADRATQDRIVQFVTAASSSPDEDKFAIPTGLVIAGPSIASHGPFFERLGRRVRTDTDSAYVVLSSGECTNLKTLLKNLIKKVTLRTDDEDEEELDQPVKTSRSAPKLLNYDLGLVQEWRKKNPVSSIVVTLQDSEAFDSNLLTDMVDLLHSWLDRLPLILMFGIATSAESFEDRLSGRSLRYLQGEKFDVAQSDDIIEKLFRVTVAQSDATMCMGPGLCRRILDRQKDYIQSVQDFSDGLKYAYMSHFYANYPSIILKDNVTFDELLPEAFDAIRNLPSFRRWVEKYLEDGKTQEVRELLTSNEGLFNEVLKELRAGQKAMSAMSHAAEILHSTRQALQMSPAVRFSTLWTRAAANELAGSPLLRETMLSIKKISSDNFAPLLEVVAKCKTEHFPLDIDHFQAELSKLTSNQDSNAPLRTQYDVRNDSLRTTVVAQKVLLSKHKAALSEQDRAYSDLVGRFHDELEAFFESSLINPQALFLSEVLIHDLKSPHAETFQPKPRFAIERALASPHDYLGCDCCSVAKGAESSLSATQPATAIVYQLYLESGALINVSDLWSAFKAIAGDESEENESKTMAVFQRALAELRYLGLVKTSRKKTDHIAKVMWKGL